MSGIYSRDSKTVNRSLMQHGKEEKLEMKCMPISINSDEEEFVYIDYPETSPDLPSSIDLPGVFLSRDPPLSAEKFYQLLDSEGRLTDEHEFRKLVFKGGISPEIRQEAWRFLFGFCPFQSTRRERSSVLKLERYIKYRALRSRWKDYIQREHITDPDIETYPELPSPSVQPTFNKVALYDEDACHRLSVMELQAQLYADGYHIDREELINILRMVDKDVPRTDRDHPFFSGDNNPNLIRLRNVLVTFSVFHPSVGYAQGMNDLLGRFLVVFENEEEAYWCFTNFMENMQKDFHEEGMVERLGTLHEMLMKIDPQLASHLSSCDVGDLMFCHRWMLLWFQREFTFDDGLQIIEILSSHYLEMTSLEADRAREAYCKKNFQEDGGKVSLVSAESEDHLTFELFVCISILVDNRRALLHCRDAEDVFKLVFRLPQQQGVNHVLSRAENLFYNYYCRSLDDCFLVIETTESSLKEKPQYIKNNFIV